MGYGITLAIGIALLLFSLFILNNTLSFIKKSERAAATVISLEEVKDSDGITFKPVFKFFTYDKKEIQFCHFASSSPPVWSVGERAGVCYDVNDPTNAKLLTYFGAFGWTIILMALAMPMLVVGGGYYLSRFILN